MFASFNRFEIEMTLEQAEAVSHQGQCDDDVLWLSEQPEIIEQLTNIEDDALIAELSEYGAWDDDELKDRHDNEQRILWIAGGNIIEENL